MVMAPSFLAHLDAIMSGNRLDGAVEVLERCDGCWRKTPRVESRAKRAARYAESLTVILPTTTHQDNNSKLTTAELRNQLTAYSQDRTHGRYRDGSRPGRAARDHLCRA